MSKQSLKFNNSWKLQGLKNIYIYYSIVSSYFSHHLQRSLTYFSEKATSENKSTVTFPYWPCQTLYYKSIYSSMSLIDDPKSQRFMEDWTIIKHFKTVLNYENSEKGWIHRRKENNNTNLSANLLNWFCIA